MKNLGFSQVEIELIASVGNTGVYLSLLVGFALEYFGLQTVVFAGSMFIFVGYLYLYLAVTGVVYSNLAIVSLLYFLSQLGVCCHISSAVTFCIQLFPSKARGKAVGLGKGYYALSAAVLGDLTSTFFENSTEELLLFIAIFVPLIGIFGSSLANLIPESVASSYDYEYSHDINTSFYNFYIHWSVLFVLLFVLAWIQYSFSVTPVFSDTLAIILMAWIFSIQIIPDFHGPRVIYIGKKNYGIHDHSHGSLGPETLECADPVAAIENPPVSQFSDKSNDILLASESKPSLSCFYGNPRALLFVISTWRFWVLYVIFAIITGSAFMILYNLNAIATSLGIESSAFFVSLFSLANGMGRVVGGFVADRCSHTISKLQWMCLIAILMSLFHGVLAFDGSWVVDIFVFSCVGVGFLFGGSVSLVAVNIADLFGSRHVATNFGAMDSAPIIGSYLFATLSVALFYNPSSSETCVGTACYRVPFIVNTVFNLVAGALCWTLHSWTPIDQKIFESKKRDRSRERLL